jgi:hypothetical protein
MEQEMICISNIYETYSCPLIEIGKRYIGRISSQKSQSKVTSGGEKHVDTFIIKSFYLGLGGRKVYSFPKELFVTIEDWRQNQIGKILE